MQESISTGMTMMECYYSPPGIESQHDAKVLLVDRNPILLIIHLAGKVMQILWISSSRLVFLKEVRR